MVGVAALATAFGLAAPAAGADRHSRAGHAVVHAARVVTITIPANHAKLGPQHYGYAGPPRADVYLPAGYSPKRAYPLVLLLHGLGGSYSWYDQWHFYSLFASTHAIVVTPEGGNGWYTDWWNDGKLGDPQWETYELNDVLPTILHRYRIKPQRRYHAIVGASMGGLGATYLGGRLPGFFGTVASLSGFVDLGYSAQLVAAGMSFLGGNHNELDATDGPPDGYYLAGHDPTRLAANLRHTRVFEVTGTGVPSQAGLDALTEGGLLAIPEGTAAESAVIYPMNQPYHRALVAAGVQVSYHAFRGGHDLPDFNHEVQALLAWGLFKPVVSHPRHWTNETVASQGALWGISYRFHTSPDQVVTFRRSGRRLRISAAGSAVTLTTTAGRVIRTSTPATVRL